jgi:hypothetical protein
VREAVEKHAARRRRGRSEETPKSGRPFETHGEERQEEHRHPEGGHRVEKEEKRPIDRSKKDPARRACATPSGTAMETVSRKARTFNASV